MSVRRLPKKCRGSRLGRVHVRSLVNREETQAQKRDWPLLRAGPFPPGIEGMRATDDERNLTQMWWETPVFTTRRHRLLYQNWYRNIKKWNVSIFIWKNSYKNEVFTVESSVKCIFSFTERVWTHPENFDFQLNTFQSVNYLMHCGF